MKTRRDKLHSTVYARSRTAIAANTQRPLTNSLTIVTIAGVIVDRRKQRSLSKTVAASVVVGGGSSGGRAVRGNRRLMSTFELSAGGQEKR